MNSTVWLGIDIGTTGVRAVAYEPNGNCLGSADKQYPLYTPYPEWAEQDPDEIVGATAHVIRSVAATLAAQGRQADGIAFSSVFHSFLAYDKTGRPITKLMTWADNRSSKIVSEWKKTRSDLLEVYRRTGCPTHPMYPATKIAWLRQEKPTLFQEAAFFGSIKDYIFKIFTGEWVVDRSIASGSGLYNLQSLEWDKEVLAYLKVSEANMPPVVSTTYTQKLNKETAIRLGLPSGIPVVIGAGDGVLVNVGIGAVRPGQISATIGTSGAVRMLHEKPLTDPKGRTWCYNLTDQVWVLGGAINNGGIALRWVRDQLAQKDIELAEKLGVDAYDLMTAEAAKIPAGAEGLLLLPFFAGERAPNWNSDVRATLFGLTLNHTKSHIARATLEGICFRMHSILEALSEVVGPAQDIRVSGSFIKSPLWLQILSDIFNQKVNVPSVNEGAAFGAAVLGFVAAGILPDISATADFVTVTKSYEPRLEAANQYKKLYDIYERVYWNLQKEFTDIANFQKNG